MKESDRMRQEMEKVTARADAERSRRKRSEWDRRSGANMYVEAECGQVVCMSLSLSLSLY